jgi:hypothetical protein
LEDRNESRRREEAEVVAVVGGVVVVVDIDRVDENRAAIAAVAGIGLDSAAALHEIATFRCFRSIVYHHQMSIFTED